MSLRRNASLVVEYHVRNSRYRWKQMCLETYSLIFVLYHKQEIINGYKDTAGY